MSTHRHHHIIRFYKPYGVHTKFTDAAGRPTLADYIDLPNVYPAGRLDHDSEGLLLLTDDGTLNARLTQPQYAHPRTYLVQVERIPSTQALVALREGVVIQGEKTRPATVKIVTPPSDLPYRSLPVKYEKAVPTSFLQITLTEGRNRQVRRMTAAVGHPTIRLIRIAIGPLTLDGLMPGMWQALTPQEKAALWQSIGWQP